jgi:hypothetical protein
VKHWLVLAALCACVAANAEPTRRPAGGCDVYAPEPEDPTLTWDYWWSGDCAAGLATGDGYLFEFMKHGGFGDVYAAAMVRGRATGRITAYGPAFLGTEWRVRSGAADGSGEWPPGWQPLDASVPRHMLPASLQQAIDRFASDVGHPQMPSMPLHTDEPRCLAEGARRVREQGFGAARKAVLEALLTAAAQKQDLQAPLRAATAVAGCAEQP